MGTNVGPYLSDVLGSQDFSKVMKSPPTACEPVLATSETEGVDHSLLCGHSFYWNIAGCVDIQLGFCDIK